MSAATTSLAELAGTDLGTHTAAYDETAAILYALAVGATSTELVCSPTTAPSLPTRLPSTVSSQARRSDRAKMLNSSSRGSTN